MPSDPTRVSLDYHLRRQGVENDLRHLIGAIARASKYIVYALGARMVGGAGSLNVFGEEQIKMDVLSNRIIEQELCECGLVSMYVSEENPEAVTCTSGAGRYAVAFDPLDGSSLVDVDFAVGSIFGVYEGNEMFGRVPREQVAALYVVYGPRTRLVYAVAGKGVHEFELNDVGEYVLSREFLGVGDTAKHFAPGNLRVCEENPAYRKVVLDWLERGLTLRYSGGMVPDVHHILRKGDGVFCYPGGGKKYPQGKLRLVFECGPLSYLMVEAGGASSDGKGAILEKEIEQIDQRTPIIIGSKDEVERVVELLSTVEGY
jgi:fructose-1,6-bisphosphatase I